MSAHSQRFQSLAQLQIYLKDNEPTPGSSYTLDRMQQVVARLHHPERRYRVVHVGGTSGKGSTCQMIARILQAAGYSVGLYTSPALVTPLERMTVNGKAITERVALRLTNQLWPKVHHLAPTHFEFFSLLAFIYFAERQVDYAVIEVGVGGKYDATNVVQPKVAVVTDIGLDHTALLGKTRQQIAQDKQAIIKPGCIGLTGSRYVKRGQYIPLDRSVIHQATLAGTEFSYKSLKHVHLTMVGSYQVRNAILAIEVAQRLGIASQAIRFGLHQAYQPGRFEVVHTQPLIIVDGAHNPQKMQAFVQSLKQLVSVRAKKIIAVCAVKHTKDLPNTLKYLIPCVDEFILTTFPRSYPLAAVERVIRRYDRTMPIRKVSDPIKAYQQLQARLDKADVGIVTGSLYLIGKLYRVL